MVDSYGPELLKKVTINSWRKKTVSLEEIPEDTFQFAFEEENLVLHAIKKLPEKYRTVIALYYFEDFSTEQISRILQVKAETVCTQLMRGRKMLKEQLKGDYFDET